MMTGTEHFQLRLQFITDNAMHRFVVHLKLAVLPQPLPNRFITRKSTRFR